MLKKSKTYRSKNFTATLSDDPSGIWYLNVACKTERNGVSGTIVGHIPLCLDLEETGNGDFEAVLSLLDEEEEKEEQKKNGECTILQFPGKR